MKLLKVQAKIAVPPLETYSFSFSVALAFGFVAIPGSVNMMADGVVLVR